MVAAVVAARVGSPEALGFRLQPTPTQAHAMYRRTHPRLWHAELTACKRGQAAEELERQLHAAKADHERRIAAILRSVAAATRLLKDFAVSLQVCAALWMVLKHALPCHTCAFLEANMQEQHMEA